MSAPQQDRERAAAYETAREVSKDIFVTWGVREFPKSAPTAPAGMLRRDQLLLDARTRQADNLNVRTHHSYGRARP